MKRFSLIFAAIGIATAGTAPAQDHSHLNIGAIGTAQGDPLIFDNGADFVTDSGYVKTLTYTNGGTYAGYFQANITLVALPTTVPNGGPAPNAPAFGSWIFAQLVSVDGPPGGSFAFWNSGATSPTISLASGTTGTNTWVVSNNQGAPGTDPFGHIHGRRFTATRPGLYTVGFRAWDFSANGLGNGPIHTPSEVLKIRFQAGVTITSLERTNDTAAITFGATANRDFALEYAASLADTNWNPTGDPITGNDYFQSLTDTNAADSSRFYRIKDVTP